jgi:phosphoribosylamine--glycine ligase
MSPNLLRAFSSSVGTKILIGVTALGKDLRAAQAAAYAAVEAIQFEGAQFRRDIAAKAFNF